MPAILNASLMFDRSYLEMRHRILDLAAALDRIESAPGAASIAKDPRRPAINEALAILTDGQPDRATRVQMVFSDSYEEG